MTSPLAYFTRTDDGDLLPTRYARSRWGAGLLNGPAVVALVAHELERAAGDPELVPGRLTVDLFKAARQAPTTVRTRAIRAGRRIRTTFAEVIQGDTVVAQATLIQYRPSAPPPGTEWAPQTTLDRPPSSESGIALPWLFSEPVGWTREIAGHQDDTRKSMWATGLPAIAGEPLTPFVRAASVSESTSLLTNLGTSGIGYINGDLTLALTRAPVGDWVGIRADTHLAADGLSVGTTTLYDQQGAIGTGLVTAISNAQAQIDFGRVDEAGEPPTRQSEV
ncbi:acyl-CoA thioesterase domain-containing protein [Williamsia sterculiae]|uniref:Thioesterase-like superfamily protein n=1 Tax=Williamsia sterculiae TaxID=1344003 RepID=A0A1N7CGK0_9NOCA|nr:acyl-CoA thioesterase domain-containing protein [Williamsia sterculiae]SIR62695.1 Thioesterase-like superfamily protein [Williamsia sterculiae]